MNTPRWHLVLALVSIAAAACSGPGRHGGSARGGVGAGAPVARDVAALQRLERAPVACTTDGDCPLGSHCDPAKRSCAFSCLADSDCAGGQSCDSAGSCVSARRFTPYLSVTADSCSTIPVAQRLAALADLDANPVTCFGDELCPCGSYCGPDATCKYDCLVDNPTSQPLCASGLVCSGEGRCIQPDHSNDPTYTVDLQLAPELLNANTAAAAVLVPATVRVRAKQASFVGNAANVTVSLAFAEASKTAPSVPALMPRVRCAPSAPLAASCDLAGGWLIGVPGDPLLSQPRQIWVELPRDTNSDTWGLTARSAWSDGIASATVAAQPVVTPPHQTGHFAGTLSWPQANGDPLTLPIDAYVTATRVALLDPSRVLLPDGPAVLSRAATQTTQLTWLWTETPSPLATVNLDLDSWSFDPAHETITAGVHLSEPNGPAPTLLTITMKYAGDPTASCTVSSSCGTGSYCNADIGLCLPGTRANSVIYTDGAATPTLTANPPALQQQWTPALSQLRANNLATLGGDDIIGLEKVTCFNDPAQSFAGRLGSNDNTNSRDVLCEGGSAQQVFPYADLTSAVTVDASGNTTFSLLDSCVADLNVTATAPFTPAHLLDKKPCVSLARFLLAKTTTSPSSTYYPQVARRRLENQLSREWLTLHALIARTAAQESEYDTIAGVSDLPAADRLGNYVDLLERDWRLVVRPKRTLDADRAAAQKPDYRTLARPVAYWTFNGHNDGAVADDETHTIPMHFSHLASPDAQRLALQKTGLNWHGRIIDGAGCTTDADVALPSRHFSLVAWIGASGTTSDYVLFDKTNWSTGDYFRINVYDYSTTQRYVTASDSRGGIVTFIVYANAGWWAFVEDGGSYSLINFYRDANNNLVERPYSPWTKTGAGPEFGSAGRVSLGCNPQSGTVLIDELSLWEKPLTSDALLAIATPYTANDPSVVSIPPSQLAIDATDEQANGLAVHLVDAAAAQMSLLSSYVAAEGNALFAECGNPTGPAHARVLGRVGRGLRFASLLENDAADLAALAGATAQPWLARYTSTQKLLAGKRAAVVHALDVASRCVNPLGVSDSDVPLFHGEAVGDSAKFFASSQWLSTQAQTQIDQAGSELQLARTAWEQQRESEFQNKVLAPAETAERVHDIESQYESQIRLYCGAPATGTIMDGIRNGTITTANCDLKLEDPACAGAQSQPVSAVSASCLRGQIGEQIVAVQSAGIDQANAENAYDRAIAQWDSQVEYCTRRSTFNQATYDLMVAHRATMQSLRSQRENDGFIIGYVKNLVQTAVGVFTMQPQLAVSAGSDQLGKDEAWLDSQLSHAEQDEESKYQLELAARANVLDAMACLHEADNYKFAIDAAHDVIKRSYQTGKSAVLHLTNLQTEVSALVKQANGDIEVEQNLPRVLPHHHYWLSDHIDNYRRHFRYAQRLTYLALRAFEYESQQSIGYRNDVLTAQTLATLDQVVMVLGQHTAPMQGEAGFTTGSFAPVMSLRDEILQLGAVPGQAPPPPGFPTVDAQTALRNYLKSDAAKIYDGDTYLGRGIRFAITPPGWAQLSCAERIWRVTAALQVQGSPINNARMLLWQENSFGSQQCHASSAGKLHVATVQPNHNLLVDDSGSFDGSPFVTPVQYTPMEVDGLGNKTRDDLAALPQGLHSGFAGRGLYGNYVLLFPSQQFETENPSFYDNVKDVLFRFDLVEATNVTGNPNL